MKASVQLLSSVLLQGALPAPIGSAEVSLPLGVAWPGLPLTSDLPRRLSLGVGPARCTLRRFRFRATGR